MIVVNVYGGLGNQLFQYAAGRQLSEKHHSWLKLDIRNFERDKRRQYALRYFNIKENFFRPFERTKLKLIGRVKRLTGKSVIYKEQKLDFDPRVLTLGNNVYLDGHWQSEKYFKSIENIIRSEFVIKTPPSAMNARYLERIKSVNAVAVHIRRGDYVSDAVTNAVHGVCDMSYYSEAVNRIAMEVSNPSFFIFSDDMRWTMENVVITQYPATYVDHNRDAAHEDLRLMYSCKHHIIANSSFSWWGAWLGSHTDKKVIAPKQWFKSEITNKDIVPEEWQKL